MMMDDEVIGEAIASYSKLGQISQLVMKMNGQDVTVPPIDDVSIIWGGDEAKDYEAIIQSAYDNELGKDQLHIEEIVIKDPRSGYQHLNVRVTSYNLTIGIETLKEIVSIPDIGEVLDETMTINPLPEDMAIKLYVSDSAKLLMVTIGGASSDMDFDVSFTLK